MNETFLVLATYGSGHGTVTVPVLLTNDVRAAYETCMEATDGHSLGYRFTENEDGVCIYRLGAGVTYGKHAHGQALAGRNLPLAYFRTWDRHNGEWRERWHDDELKRRATKHPAPDR